MRPRSVACRTLAASVCALFTACSSLPVVPPGHELAIRLGESTPDISVAVPASAAPAVAGGTMGAGVGAAASVGCGLLVFVCLPIFAVAGGAAGGAAGAMAGAPERAQRASAEDLRKRLSVAAREADAGGQLTARLSDKAAAHWRVVASSNTHRLIVHVTGISLELAPVEQTSLSVRAIVVMTQGDASTGYSRAFDHTGPPASAAQWAQESGEFLNAAIARACDGLARQIVEALLTGPSASR